MQRRRQANACSRSLPPPAAAHTQCSSLFALRSLARSCPLLQGFSEEALETLSASLRETVISAPKGYYRFGDSLKPDVWFDTSQARERGITAQTAG